MSADTLGKADLHIHTTYSDGGHDVRAVLAHVAEETDLDVIAITDHDCIDGALEAQRLAPEYGLQVIVGQEVTTSRGHLLALFIHQRIPSGLSIPETVARVHEQGGLAILAHPYDRICNSPMRHWPQPTMADWLSFGVDGLEAINGCQVDPRSNTRATHLASLMGVSMTGGSDAHHKEVVGVACTRFPGRTPAELRQAIEQRDSLAEGRRWNLTEYLGWVAKSFIPRSLRRLRPQARPQLRPEFQPQPSLGAQVVFQKSEDGRLSPNLT